MIAFLFAFIGAIAAVTAEWLYKQPFVIENIWGHLYLWLPIQFVIGYCVFRMVNLPGTNLLDAFVVFAFFTAFLRIIVSTSILHQTIPTQSWVAFGLLLAATCVKTFWSQA